MVTYGLEAIDRFDLYRANHPNSEVHDLKCTKECDALDDILKEHHHIKKFYRIDFDVFETHLNDVGLKDDLGTNGMDYLYADDVEFFMISTHGGHDEYGNISLTYNTHGWKWHANSKKWKLGDKSLKWLVLSACSTIDIKNLLGLLPIFHGLHMICGAYGSLRGRVSEAEDFGEGLTEYEPVSEAWINAVDGESHPMVVAAEKIDSVSGKGQIDWSQTTMDRDSFKTKVPNISNSDIAWFSLKWKESKKIKQKGEPI